jgi:hypothetical protein
LNSALAFSSFSGSRQWDFVKLGVAAGVNVMFNLMSGCVTGSQTGGVFLDAKV